MSESPLYLPRNCIVPLRVREDAGLPDGAKIYFGELNVLTHKFGYVYASDEQLAEMKGVSLATIERWHKLLEAGGHIWRNTTRIHQVNPDTGKLEIRTKRLLYVADESGAFSTNVTDPSQNRGPIAPSKIKGRSDPSKMRGINNQSLNNESSKQQQAAAEASPLGVADDEGDTSQASHAPLSSVGGLSSSSQADPGSNKECAGNIHSPTGDDMPDEWRWLIDHCGWESALSLAMDAVRSGCDSAKLRTCFDNAVNIRSKAAWLRKAIRDRYDVQEPAPCDSRACEDASWRSKLSERAERLAQLVESFPPSRVFADGGLLFYNGESYRFSWSERDLSLLESLLSPCLDIDPPV